MMTEKPYIVQYHEAIERGYIDIDGKQVRLVVGEKIRKVVDRLMTYFDNQDIVFNPKKCYKKFDFEEHYCLQ